MRYIFFLFLVFISYAFSKEPIRVAPLPMENSEKLMRGYKPFVEYLQREIDYPFERVYYADYDTLMKKIVDGEVDIALLGPLPYIELKNRLDGVKPIVRFLGSLGEEDYTCTLFTTKNHDIKDLKKLKNPQIALTQKFSTCGYFGAEMMLQKNNLSLKDAKYNFTGSHTNVILYVTLGDYDMGSVKTSILNKYNNLNIVKLDETPYFAGFVLTASPNVDNILFEKIQKTLIKLRPLENQEDKLTVKNWMKNLSYGCIKAKDSDYDNIRELLQKISIKEINND
ncbi:MAG: PhnD/SsuA/transferrin family substrate-binding protein [Campylobacterales bacterium]|nr:PhnD/SsuA/transferrin family substrate-binding protein [Campylobacterales bacterium]